VTEHDRQLCCRYLRIAEVQIGATHAAGLDFEQQLPRPGLRVGQGDELQRLLLTCEERRADLSIMLHVLYAWLFAERNLYVDRIETRASHA
jgi:hypothetical protein